MMQWEKENEQLKDSTHKQSFLEWIVGRCDRLLFGSEAAADSEPEFGIWAPARSDKVEDKTDV